MSGAKSPPEAVAAAFTRDELLDLNAAVRHYRDNGLDRGSPAARRLEALHRTLLQALDHEGAQG